MFCSLLFSEDSGRSPGLSAPAEESRLTFEELYEKYATDVLRLSYYYLHDRQRAEDVTQDVFLRFLQYRQPLIAGREKAWLLRVALNRCRDLWKSSWLKRVTLGDPGLEWFPAEDEIGAVADSLTLADAVSHLPPQFREVVLLHYYQGCSVPEIAEILGTATGTVSSRLSRSREKLQKELKGE